MKEAIYTDKGRAERLWEKCQQAAPAMQGIIDALATTECDFSAEDIWKLTNQNVTAERVTEAVMDKKLKAESLRIFGIKLSRAKLREMVEIENMPEILEALEIAKSGHNGESFRDVQRFVKIKDGTAYIVDTAQKDIEEMCTMYATTKEQVAKVEAVKAAANALNNMYQSGAARVDWLDAPQIDGLDTIRTDADGWGYVPNLHTLRRIVEN